LKVEKLLEIVLKFRFFTLIKSKVEVRILMSPAAYLPQPSKSYKMLDGNPGGVGCYLDRNQIGRQG